MNNFFIFFSSKVNSQFSPFALTGKFLKIYNLLSNFGQLLYLLSSFSIFILSVDLVIIQFLLLALSLRTPRYLKNFGEAVN